MAAQREGEIALHEIGGKQTGPLVGGRERQEHAQRRPVGCAEAQARDDRSEDHADRRTGCNGEQGEDDANREQRRRGAHRLPGVEGARRQDERPPETISAETTAAPTSGERIPVASIMSEGINER